MSTKRKTYSAEFKAKVVLEVLEAEQTLNQIASKYELLPANVKNWKKMFDMSTLYRTKNITF